MEHVHGPFSLTQVDEPVSDGVRGRFCGASRRLFEGLSPGEQRRQGRGVRTARPVRRRHVVTLDRDLDVAAAR